METTFKIIMDQIYDMLNENKKFPLHSLLYFGLLNKF